MTPSPRGQYRDVGSRHFKAFDSKCEKAIQLKCLLSLNFAIPGSINISLLFLLFFNTLEFSA